MKIVDTFLESVLPQEMVGEYARPMVLVLGYL